MSIPRTAKEIVTLSKYPFISLHAGLQSDIRIGDLHGNALKLLYFLIKEGVLKISPEQYKQFVEIYAKPIDQLTLEDIALFNDIIESATLNNNPPKITLIGDELFDRGSNDYFVIKILDHIQQHNVQVDIMASNHGFEFLQAFENEFKDTSARYLGEVNTFGRSYVHLHYLMNRFPVLKEKTKDMVNRSYKPNLKLIGYSLDIENNSITIDTHAPVGIITIQEIAEKLGITFMADSPAELASTIDEINEQFIEKLDAGKGNEIFPADVFVENDPFYRLIWNRYSEHNEYDLPEGTYNGFNVHFVHGHDGAGFVPDSASTYVTNLDNLLGKDLPDQPNFVGEYSVSISPTSELLTAEQSLSHINPPLNNILVNCYAHLLRIEANEDQYNLLARNFDNNDNNTITEVKNILNRIKTQTKDLLDIFQQPEIILSEIPDKITFAKFDIEDQMTVLENLPTFDGKTYLMNVLENTLLHLDLAEKGILQGYSHFENCRANTEKLFNSVAQEESLSDNSILWYNHLSAENAKSYQLLLDLNLALETHTKSFENMKKQLDIIEERLKARKLKEARYIRNQFNYISNLISKSDPQLDETIPTNEQLDECQKLLAAMSQYESRYGTTQLLSSNKEKVRLYADKLEAHIAAKTQEDTLAILDEFMQQDKPTNNEGDDLDEIERKYEALKKQYKLLSPEPNKEQIDALLEVQRELISQLRNCYTNEDFIKDSQKDYLENELMQINQGLLKLSSRTDKENIHPTQEGAEPHISPRHNGPTKAG